MVKIEPDALNSLAKVSSADCFQIRSVSENRFIKKLGKINASNLRLIEIGLSSVLKI
jgi:mRNA interferase MazF